jgi:hypothetical protein
MRTIYSLVLASFVLASSGSMSQDDSGIATQVATYDELDATAGVATAAETELPVVSPAVNRYQYSDDNS